MKRVILRADGNSQIGLGHVYRLLALAEMLKEEFECVFAINEPDEFVLNEIQKSCSSYIILKDSIQYQMPDLVKAGDEIPFDLGEYLSGNDIVVTDGYLFGERYQLSVKSTGAKLVCIDDLAVNHFFGNVVINHAPGIDRSLYNLEPGTLLLAGLDYVMLRQAFFKPFEQKDHSLRNAFISLGGSDYFHYTKKLVQFLLEDGSFKTLHVLTSSTFSLELLSYLNGLGSASAKINLHHNLSAEELVIVMDSCTHAFVAASTILIESYSRGLKCFAGFYTENQRFVYNGFTSQNLAAGLGSFDKIDKEGVLEKLKNQNDISYLTTPFSSTEILKTFRSFDNRRQKNAGFDYKLREINAADINLLFEWANDPEVRYSAVNSGKISFEEHNTWFNKKMDSHTCKIFILELENVPAGQARFEFNDADSVWEIDYSISKKFRGLGLGKLLLEESIKCLDKYPLTAYVKQDNLLSQNVFKGLGFTSLGFHDIKNTKLLKYIKSYIS